MALAENHANRLALQQSAPFAELRRLHGLQSLGLQNGTEGLAGFGVRSDNENLFVVHVKLLGTGSEAQPFRLFESAVAENLDAESSLRPLKLFTQLPLIMMRNCR